MTFRPQATLEQVLGIERKKCIFQEKFRFEPCRSCTGYNYRCGNYLSEIRTYEVDKQSKRKWGEMQ